jgi:hypothetical protein
VPRKKGESVTVLRVRHLFNADAPEDLRTQVEAVLLWDAAPELTFELVVAPRGVVLSFRAAGDGGVSARQLHMVPLGRMQRAVRRAITERTRPMDWPTYRKILRAEMEEAGVEADDETIRKLWKMGEAGKRRRARDFAETARPTGNQRANRRYAEVAAMYVDLLGEERPIVALAKKLNLGEKTVRNYLYKARDRGLLTTAGQGRAGGELTDEARRILSGSD